jgi:hypothetical protein
LTRLIQGSIERSHLDRFRQALPDFPRGEIRANLGQQPDFLVLAPSGVVGIEHTQLFQTAGGSGQERQALESKWQRVLDLAREKYESRLGPPLHLTASFDDRRRLSEARIEAAAEDLVQVVLAAQPASDGIPSKIGGLRRRGVLPPEMISAYIYPASGSFPIVWGLADGGWIPEWAPADLQAHIDRKEQKLDIYRANCSAVWLLMVEDGSTISRTLDLSRETLLHQYRSRFDRIFLFKAFDTRVVELLLERDTS